MVVPFKTFNDLVFLASPGRNEAIIHFGKGYGIHIWKDVKWHDRNWRYAGTLLTEGNKFLGSLVDVHYRTYMTPEDVTGYMKEVQEME